MMCRVLSVSRSGFYAWLKRPVSRRDQKRALVSMAVESAYVEFKKRYGAPRLTVELNAQRIPCSLHHVTALLQEGGLRARNGKGFRYYPRTEAMTNVNDNLLRRHFDASAPNPKWVSDITYIKVLTQNRWLGAGQSHAGEPDPGGAQHGRLEQDDKARHFDPLRQGRTVPG